MWSRELLVLLEELPEESSFKQARDLTMRLVEHEEKLLLFHAHGALPDGAKLIAEFVDWTFERKLLARNTRELVALRGDLDNQLDTDLNNLLEPLDALLVARERQKQVENVQGAKRAIRAGLYAYERR